MRTYQIIIQSDEDIEGIDFQSTDGESAKVVSIIDITSMFNEKVTDFMKNIDIGEDVAEA
jgi:hypothetical protein